MPVEYVGFTLKPNNFFDGSPAMDLPRETADHSVLAKNSQSCCD
jgi:primary-amine oxidase